MSESSHSGGITGGLFALFDIIGMAFFFVLIGSRASRDKLRNTRVVLGSIIFCSGICFFVFLWNISWFDTIEPSKRITTIILLTLLAGVAGGSLLGAILVGYVESIEREERRRKEKAERRERLIAQGKDPDKHCFVASFAFDNAASPEVLRLRSWRDSVLLKSRCGVVLAHAYHRISPHIVTILMPYPFLKEPIRKLLRMFIFIVRA